MLRQQLQKEKDNIKKNKQLTKDAIQKKIEVNQMSQWVSFFPSRKTGITNRRSCVSTNSVNATRRFDLPTKNSFRISRRPST